MTLTEDPSRVNRTPLNACAHTLGSATKHMRAVTSVPRGSSVGDVDHFSAPLLSGKRWSSSGASEWNFTDDRATDRFSHGGDTIVPGAGVRWKHVHRATATPQGNDRFLYPEAVAPSGAVTEAAEDDEDVRR